MIPVLSAPAKPAGTPVDAGSPVYQVLAPTGSVLWEGNVTDPFGCMWVVEKEDGWSSSVPLRRSDLARANASGDFRGKGYLAGRVVQLSGMCVCPSRIAMLQAKDRISATAPQPDVDYTLFVREAHLTRGVLLGRADSHKADDRGDRVFAWSLSLRSVDPIRYAGLPSAVTIKLPNSPVGRRYPRRYPLVYGAAATSGSAVLSNPGNYPVSPLLRIRGPVTNPRVENSTLGQVLTLACTLSASDYLDIDTDINAVTLNGSASRRSWVRPGSSFPVVAPGGNTFAFHASAYNTTSSLLVSYRGGWT